MITVHNIFFLTVLLVLLAILIVSAGYYYTRHRRNQKFPYGNFETLLRRLSSVDRDNVALIARDFVDESGHRRIDEDDLDLDPSQIWPLIGGLKGLQALERNCAVLVDLVFYVQQWYPEALALAEQLRLNAREIAWHIERLKSAEKTGNLQSSFSDNAQRAVAIYYVMTRRVLALYEQLNVPGLIELQRSL